MGRPVGASRQCRGGCSWDLRPAAGRTFGHGQAVEAIIKRVVGDAVTASALASCYSTTLLSMYILTSRYVASNGRVANITRIQIESILPFELSPVFLASSFSRHHRP